MKCDFCGENILSSKQTKTHNGKHFCNYECMSDFYNYEIPDDEDFLCVEL